MVEIIEVCLCYILIKLLIILSEEKVCDMLKGFVKDLCEGKVDFVELVKEYFEDLGFVLKGGEYDWIDLSIYVFEFKNILFLFDKNEISEFFRM